MDGAEQLGPSEHPARLTGQLHQQVELGRGQLDHTIAHRHLAARLGRFTAVAALGLIGAVITVTAAAASPHCPGADATGRCTAPELANWTVNGLLLPLTAAVILGVPLLLGRLSLRFGKAGVRFHRAGGVASIVTRVRGNRSPGTTRRKGGGGKAAPARKTTTRRTT